MLSTLLVLILASISTALPAPPKPTCQALVEDLSWTLSDLAVIYAPPDSPIASSISFHFCSTNPGLQLETQCNYSMAIGSGAKPEQAGGYHACGNATVRFSYLPGRVDVERVYIDPCLGEYPYNGGIYFGHAEPTWEVTKASDGERWTQTVLEVPITSQD